MIIRLRYIIIFIIIPFFVAAQPEVTFSVPGGFHDDVFELSLSYPDPNCQIHFTLNGNTPTVSDLLYQGPLTLSENLFSKADIFKITIHSPIDNDYCPDHVNHAIVIRAAAFDVSGNCVSKVTTQTYLVKALGADTHGLPVVSLCADSLALFDYHTGIMVPGVHLDPNNPKYTGNYYQKGNAWERPCNVECYSVDTCHFNQQAGLRTHGESSRRYSQKGLKIYARKEYGKKRFEHTLFEETGVTKFKHLVLKPFSCSWNHSGVGDYLCDHLAKGLNFESTADCPVVLFLNGEYWGIYFLKEKPDEEFLADHFGVDEDDCTIMSDWDGHVDCGDSTNFLSMMAWLETADLSDSSAYAYLSSLIDVVSFTDYMVFETFVKNLDWPSHNMRCWQENSGPWRWIFFDGDACFQRTDFDVFANATYTGDLVWPSSKPSTLLFRKLLENKDFVESFCVRYHDLISGQLAYANTSLWLQKAEQALDQEISAQSDRFGNPEGHASWRKTLLKIDKVLKNRPLGVYNELLEFLSNRQDVSQLNCTPNPSQGQFTLSFHAEVGGLAPVSIHNLLGQTLFVQYYPIQKGENLITLSVNLTQGVYIIRAGGCSAKVLFVN